MRDYLVSIIGGLIFGGTYSYMVKKDEYEYEYINYNKFKKYVFEEGIIKKNNDNDDTKIKEYLEFSFGKE